MSRDAIQSSGQVPIAPSRRGHFQLESGHHGNRWLDLALPCLRLERVAPSAARLGRLLAQHRAELVCGPLVPFVALHERPNSIWVPSECPLCAVGTPLSNAGPEAGVLGARVEPPR